MIVLILILLLVCTQMCSEDWQSLVSALNLRRQMSYINMFIAKVPKQEWLLREISQNKNEEVIPPEMVLIGPAFA
ncbi:hypothetical protein CEXT_334231 [Caerostris extrusa]|uniref:Secreted protein n=1 Tax=Caerostris extrusa TaxID=172846 RepID=A0AAV4X725_CAEEX|nr:hypothetical protein CEXT_334231 [Caerostris extrusa]